MAASLGVSQLAQQFSCGIFANRNEVSAEDKESPLLKVVARERLMKTQQTEKTQYVL
jgi:hypothetical protein